MAYWQVQAVSRNNYVLCPLPERALFVKGGLQRFLRVFCDKFPAQRHSFHGIRCTDFREDIRSLVSSLDPLARISDRPTISGRYGFVCEVCSVVLFYLRPCLNPSLRGRPRTVVHRPRSGATRPTPIKLIRPSCGTPRRSIIGITPGHRARSRGHIELAWSRRDSLA
jgi:hypothetical protein